MGRGCAVSEEFIKYRERDREAPIPGPGPCFEVLDAWGTPMAWTMHGDTARSIANRLNACWAMNELEPGAVEAMKRQIRALEQGASIRDRFVSQVRGDIDALRAENAKLRSEREETMRNVVRLHAERDKLRVAADAARAFILATVYHYGPMDPTIGPLRAAVHALDAADGEES